MTWLKSKTKSMLNLIDGLMHTNIKTRKAFAIFGTCIAMIHFWSNDLFSAVNYAPYEKIAVSNASFGAGFELYMTGLGFMVVYAIIGAFAAILGSELFIMLCDVINWKPRIYNTLIRDNRKCIEEELKNKK